MMFRRVVCAAVLALMLAGSAFGKVQDFGDFTADIPYGWRAKKQDDGTFIIAANNGEKGIAVFSRGLGGASAAEASQNVSRKLHGTKPRYDKKSGTYRFRFMTDGLEWQMAVRGFEEADRAVVVTWAGVGVNKYLERILGSIKAKNETETNSLIEDTLGSIKAR